MSKKPMPSHHGVEATLEDEPDNETLRLLYGRASCRHFKDQPIPDEVLNQVLRAAVHAPSGGNLQSVSLIVVRDAAKRDRLLKLCGNQKFIGEAPVNIVICYDLNRNKRWAGIENAPFTSNASLHNFLMGIQETGIVGQSVCIAADAVGLGSCYVGNALGKVPEIAEMLELPEAVFPTVLLSVGYPADPLKPVKKHRLATIIHDEKYRADPDEKLLALFTEKYLQAGAPRVEITEQRLKTLHETCRRVHGADFADKAVEYAEMLGYISPVQRYFGLHYRADGVIDRPNSGFRKIIEDRGFRLFTDYESPDS